MKDAFSKLHPFTNMLFFVFAIGFCMFLMHPVCLMISFIIGMVTAIYLNGKRTAAFSLKVLLPLLLMTVIINPVFNHSGATIVDYLPWGNPLTLESIIYGLAAAVLLCSAVLWFSCFHNVMTSDKFVYLFGKIIPSLSLLLSMTLRFVPRFRTQLQSVRKAQKAIGKDVSNGSIIKRVRNAVKILSLMISWSLENSIETSDSMKSRGYGLKGRTSFSIYHLALSDKICIFVNIAEAALLVAILFSGQMHCRYFPTVKYELCSVSAILFYCVYSLFLLTPLVINVKEEIKWKRLLSAI